MFCPNCGKEMNDSAIFCSNCGWSKESNVSKKGVLKIPKIPKVVFKSVFAVLGIVILALIIYYFPKPKGKVYELSDIGKAKLVSKYWKNSVVDNFDTVKFGSYAQSDVSGSTKEPIEWIVLKRVGNKALLLSKYIIDCKCYNDERKDVIWENCTLRNWLNMHFYNTAFSSSEQNKILTANISNNGNSVYGTNGGNNTNDKIFCLSIDEVKAYFDQNDMSSFNKRLATKGTNYANRGNALFVLYGNEWYGGGTGFWLRSSSGLQGFAATVAEVGWICENGSCVDNRDTGVRPALWVSY